MKTIDAYVLGYNSQRVAFGSGFGPDQAWNESRKAIYVPACYVLDLENEAFENEAILIKRSNNDLIYGPLYEMYDALCGESAETAWNELLTKLKIDEKDKSVKKVSMPADVLDWAKCLCASKKTQKTVEDFFKEIKAD